MAAHAGSHGSEEVQHASVRTYLVVAAVLTVVTAVEVGTYFIEWFQAHFWVLFSALSIMSIFKFALVVGFYMHLRYDAPFYRRVFVAPLVIAVIITVIVGSLTAARYALA